MEHQQTAITHWSPPPHSLRLIRKLFRAVPLHNLPAASPGCPLFCTRGASRCRKHSRSRHYTCHRSWRCDERRGSTCPRCSAVVARPRAARSDTDATIACYDVRLYEPARLGYCTHFYRFLDATFASTHVGRHRHVTQWRVLAILFMGLYVCAVGTVTAPDAPPQPDSRNLCYSELLYTHDLPLSEVQSPAEPVVLFRTQTTS